MSEIKVSQLLSSQPLKLLSNHVQDLRKLWFTEHEENRKLKIHIETLKQMAAKENNSQMIGHYLKKIDIPREVESSKALALSLFKIYFRRINAALISLKKVSFEEEIPWKKVLKLSNALNFTGRRQLKQAWNIIMEDSSKNNEQESNILPIAYNKHLKNVLARIMVKVFLNNMKQHIQHFVIAYKDSARFDQRYKDLKILCLIFHKHTNSLIHQAFYYIKNKEKLENMTINMTTDIIETLKRKSTSENFPDVFTRTSTQKITQRKSIKSKKENLLIDKQESLIKLTKLISKQDISVKQFYFSVWKELPDKLMIIEESINILESVLLPIRDKFKKKQFFSFLKCKEVTVPKGGFLLLDRIYRLRIQGTFRHIKSVQFTNQLLIDFENLSKENATKLIFSHLSSLFKVRNQQHIYTLKNHVRKNQGVNLRGLVLSKEQHHATFTLYKLATFSDSYNMKLVRNCFLEIVSYVTKSISAGTLLLDKLKSMTNCINSNRIYVLAMAIQHWKVCRPRKAGMAEQWKTVAQLKLIIEQQMYLKTSLAFKTWFRSSKTSDKSKENRVPLTSLINI